MLSDRLPESPPRSARRFSWAGVKQKVLSAAIGGSSADADGWSLEALPASFFNLEAKDAHGTAVPFSQFCGKTTLVLNVASF